MSQTHIATQDIIDIGRKHYADNDKEFFTIDDFNKNHRSNEPIRWYTRDSYLHSSYICQLRHSRKMLNPIRLYPLLDITHN
ncbi:unnamed protein product [Rotaria sordida]|uniref:Uncharacterized protein n=1 Tax=Rotaria sordida TaxID=392033 RepID=A0A818KLW5_9BILA|nr:unnamed protein product [Rotaria sordida]CAF3557376.1 unnamed protein product [Rotaria sordida]